MIAVTARPARRRLGITLTEILIAILIMGVGLISLATLFPLGLVRLRLGTQLGRAGLMFQTATDDMDSRALLAKTSFRSTWYGTRDPFVQDAYPDGTYAGAIAAGNFQFPGNLTSFGNVGTTPTPDGFAVAALETGLPICYDPLFRALTGVVPNTGLYNPTLDFLGTYAVRADEARFGSGIFANATPYLRPDADGGLASAHGLQRLTNFIPWSPNGLTPQYAFTCTNSALTAANQPADVAGNIFASTDDIVFNPPGGEVKVRDANGNALGPASSVLPDLSTGAAEADYRFTWFFTGRQVDANGNGAQFIGDIVVCDGRPFGFDPLPGASTAFAPAGETVVEAVFGVGVGGAVIPAFAGATVGYAVSNKSVLLRWRDTLADPQVRVGGWIADTTYERTVTAFRRRVATSGTTFARCNWYQVAKRSDPVADPTYPGYRSVVVTLTSPVKHGTLLDIASGQPVHSNTALVMPSVVNVFPRTFEVH